MWEGFVLTCVIAWNGHQRKKMCIEGYSMDQPDDCTASLIIITALCLTQFLKVCDT